MRQQPYPRLNTNSKQLGTTTNAATTIAIATTKAMADADADVATTIAATTVRMDHSHHNNKCNPSMESRLQRTATQTTIQIRVCTLIQSNISTTGTCVFPADGMCPTGTLVQLAPPIAERMGTRNKWIAIMLKHTSMRAIMCARRASTKILCLRIPGHSKLDS